MDQENLSEIGRDDIIIPRRNHLKCISAYQHAVKMHEAQIDRTERRKRQINYHSWRYQHLFLIIDRSTSRQKIITNIVDLISTISQLDLTDIYRMLFPKTEYTFISSFHETLTKIEYIFGYKTQFKFKRIKIMQRKFSDHNGIAVEINRKIDNPQVY